MNVASGTWSVPFASPSTHDLGVLHLPHPTWATHHPARPHGLSSDSIAIPRCRGGACNRLAGPRQGPTHPTPPPPPQPSPQHAPHSNATAAGHAHPPATPRRAPGHSTTTAAGTAHPPHPPQQPSRRSSASTAAGSPSRQAALNNELREARTTQELLQLLQDNTTCLNEVNAFTATTQAHRLIRQLQEQPQQQPQRLIRQQQEQPQQRRRNPPHAPASRASIGNSANGVRAGAASRDSHLGELLQQLVSVTAHHVDRFSPRHGVSILTAHAWMVQLVGGKGKRGMGQRGGHGWDGQDSGLATPGQAGHAGGPHAVSFPHASSSSHAASTPHAGSHSMHPAQVYQSPAWQDLLHALCDRLASQAAAVYPTDTNQTAAVSPTDVSRAVWACTKLGYLHPGLVQAASQAMLTTATASVAAATTAQATHTTTTSRQVSAHHTQKQLSRGAHDSNGTNQQQQEAVRGGHGTTTKHQPPQTTTTNTGQGGRRAAADPASHHTSANRDLVSSAYLLWALRQAAAQPTTINHHQPTVNHPGTAGQDAATTGQPKQSSFGAGTAGASSLPSPEQAMLLTLRVLDGIGNDHSFLDQLPIQDVANLLLGVVHQMRDSQSPLVATQGEEGSGWVGSAGEAAGGRQAAAVNGVQTAGSGDTEGQGVRQRLQQQPDQLRLEQLHQQLVARLPEAALAACNWAAQLHPEQLPLSHSEAGRTPQPAAQGSQRGVAQEAQGSGEVGTSPRRVQGSEVVATSPRHVQGLSGRALAAVAWSLAQLCRLALGRVAGTGADPIDATASTALVTAATAAFRALAAAATWRAGDGSPWSHFATRDVTQLVGAVTQVHQMCEAVSGHTDSHTPDQDVLSLDPTLDTWEHGPNRPSVSAPAGSRHQFAKSGNSLPDQATSQPHQLQSLRHAPEVQRLLQLASDHATHHSHSYTSQDVCEMAFALACMADGRGTPQRHAAPDSTPAAAPPHPPGNPDPTPASARTPASPAPTLPPTLPPTLLTPTGPALTPAAAPAPAGTRLTTRNTRPAALALAAAAIRNAPTMPPTALVTLVWSLTGLGVVPHGLLEVLNQRAAVAAQEAQDEQEGHSRQTMTQRLAGAQLARCDLVEDITPSHVAKLSWALAKCHQWDESASWPALAEQLEVAAALHAPDMDNQGLVICLWSLVSLGLTCIDLLEAATPLMATTSTTPTTSATQTTPTTPAIATADSIPVTAQTTMPTPSPAGASHPAPPSTPASPVSPTPAVSRPALPVLPHPKPSPAPPTPPTPAASTSTAPLSPRPKPQPASPPAPAAPRTPAPPGPRPRAPLTPQQLAVLLWSTARALSGPRPVLRGMAPLQLLHRAAPILAASAPDLSGQALAMVASAYVSAQIHPGEPLLRAIARETDIRLDQLRPYSLSLLAWALSHYGACDARALGRVADRVVALAWGLAPPSTTHMAHMPPTPSPAGDNQGPTQLPSNPPLTNQPPLQPPSNHPAATAAHPHTHTSNSSQNRLPLPATAEPRPLLPSADAPGHLRPTATPGPGTTSTSSTGTTHPALPGAGLTAQGPTTAPSPAANSTSHSTTNTTTPGGAMLSRPVRHPKINMPAPEQLLATPHSGSIADLGNAGGAAASTVEQHVGHVQHVHGMAHASHGQDHVMRMPPASSQAAGTARHPTLQPPQPPQPPQLTSLSGGAWIAQSSGPALATGRTATDPTIRIETVIGLAVSLGKARLHHPALLDLATHMMQAGSPNQAPHPRSARHAVCLLWAMATVGHRPSPHSLQGLLAHVESALSPVAKPSNAPKQATTSASPNHTDAKQDNVSGRRRSSKPGGRRAEAEEGGHESVREVVEVVDVRLVAMLLQALPALRYQPGRGLMAAVCRRLEGGAGRLSTHTLCETIWAFAALQYEPPAPLLHELLSAVEERVVTSRQELITLASTVKLAWAMSCFALYKHPLARHALSRVLGCPPDSLLNTPKLLRLLIEAKLLVEVEGRAGGFWRGVSRRWIARTRAGGPESLPVNMSGQGYGASVHTALSQVIQELPATLATLGYPNATWKATPQGELACCFIAAHVPKEAPWPNQASTPGAHMPKQATVEGAGGSEGITAGLGHAVGPVGSLSSPPMAVELPLGPSAARHARARLRAAGESRRMADSARLAVVVLCPWHLSVNHVGHVSGSHVDHVTPVVQAHGSSPGVADGGSGSVEGRALGAQGGRGATAGVVGAPSGVMSGVVEADGRMPEDMTGVGGTPGALSGVVAAPPGLAVLSNAAVHIRLLRRRGFRVVITTLDEMTGATTSTNSTTTTTTTATTARSADGGVSGGGTGSGHVTAGGGGVVVGGVVGGVQRRVAQQRVLSERLRRVIMEGTPQV